METALNGVHGWVNAADAGTTTVCPLKVLFLDGRVAISMGGQLLPQLDTDAGSWRQPLMAVRSILTAVIQVRTWAVYRVVGASSVVLLCCRPYCVWAQWSTCCAMVWWWRWFP